MSGVDLKIDGPVLTLRINRPDRRNALDPAAYEALADGLMRAARDDIRAVILTGTGERAFCSGHDLSAMVGDDPAADLRFVDGIVRAIRALEKPVIAAINGAAVGGGLSLALAADFRLMADCARYVSGFLAMALVPDLGASSFLVRALGYHRALGWICSGEPMSAAEAVANGLACAIVPSSQLNERAAGEARRLAALPTGALGLTKRLLEQAQSSTLAGALELEASFQKLAGRSADYAEALDAFRTKRPPKFTGR